MKASKRTPSFITEIPLRTSPSQESVLLARLEAARQLYNACLGEAVKRVKLIEQSKVYQFAKTLPKTMKGKPNKSRSEGFQSAWKLQGFSDYNLQAYAIGIRKSWIGEHLDAHVCQKIATRAFQAAKRMLLGQARRVRFKGKNQFDSVEGKSNAAGIRWKNETVHWKGLILEVLIDQNDPVILHGLNSRVKYVRIVRRKISGRNRFYVQLIGEGLPFQKPQHPVEAGIVGVDIGPSTLAVVGQNQAFLQPFCPEIADKANEIAKLQRKMARQQRANNPNCFHPSRCDLPKPGQKHGKRKLGHSIKGKRQSNVSRAYLKTKGRKSQLERKLAAHRKVLQGQLVHQVLSVGNQVHLEKLSYKAWQKVFGKSVGKHAPGMFVARLKQRAENAGGYVNEFPTQTTKLSQRCVCGAICKKPLSQRVHACGCGVYAQRDLFSAYLARHVDRAGCYQGETALAEFQSVDSLLWSAWQQAGNWYKQSSIGSPRWVNVGTTSASERIDPEASMKIFKTQDGVGRFEQRLLFKPS